MSETPVLDTHTWIWWVEKTGGPATRTNESLDRLPSGTRPYLSDISLWEVATLVANGRLAFSVPLADWLEAAAHPRSVQLVPMTPAIAADVAALPKTFHRDPADRVIVATCRVLQAPLATRDRRILRSRLVKRWKPSV